MYDKVMTENHILWQLPNIPHMKCELVNIDELAKRMRFGLSTLHVLCTLAKTLKCTKFSRKFSVWKKWGTNSADHYCSI